MASITLASKASVDAVKGIGWVDENLVDLDGRTETLEGDVSTAGSVLKSIKDNAKDATFTPTGTIEATDIKGAIAEVSLDVDKLNDTVAVEGSVLKSIKDNAEDATFTPAVGSGITAITLENAVNEVGTDVETLKTNLGSLEGVVDNNQLYSYEKYLELKAKADAMTLEIQASRAELYNGYRIFHFGGVDIIGKGTKSDYSAIDVSATVQDGKLTMEQKGLTITNAVTTPTSISAPFSATNAGTPTVSGGVITFTVTAAGGRVTYSPTDLIVGNVYFIAVAVKASSSFVELNRAGTTPRMSHSGGGAYEILYIIRTASDTSDQFRVADNGDGTTAGQEWEPIQTKEWIRVNLTAHGLQAITSTAILAQLLPYVKGAKSVGKMGLQILDADDNVTQTIFLPEVGNRVPNGTADSVLTVSDGWEKTKRISDETSLSGASFASYVTSYDNVDVVLTTAIALAEAGTTGTDGMLLLYNSAGTQRREVTQANIDLTASVGGYYYHTDKTIAIIVAKDAYADIAAARTGLGTMKVFYQLAEANYITTKLSLPLPVSGKTIHRFAGEEKIALYGTGLTFTENVLTVLSAFKFVAGVMTDITSLAVISGTGVTFSTAPSASDVVFVRVEHSVARPLGVMEHIPAVSNAESRIGVIEGRVDQSVKVGATPAFNGISFPATQVPSADPNTLDGCERGNWTPVVYASTSGAGTPATLSEALGKYNKIGNEVTLRFSITFSSVSALSGSIVISGLPFSGVSEGNLRGIGVFYVVTGVTVSSGYWMTIGIVSSTASVLQINGTNSINIVASNLTNTAVMRGMLVYNA